MTERQAHQVELEPTNARTIRFGNDWFVHWPGATRDTLRSAELAVRNTGATQLVHHHPEAESCAGHRHTQVQEENPDE